MIKNLIYSLVQAQTLVGCMASLFNSLFNFTVQIIGFSSLTVGALRTELSEFQGQNFKDRGTLGAQLVCFYIQAGSTAGIDADAAV